MAAAEVMPSTVGVLGVLDRSNTNPLCPDCEYRTLAIDHTRCACRRCGQILHLTARTRRYLANVFGGTVRHEVRVGDGADRI